MLNSKGIFSAVVVVVSLVGVASALPAYSASLKDLGKTLAYPVKKSALNARNTAIEGASHASKSFNHTGQAAQYPFRKSGENTSRTAHQTVKDVKKK